MAVRDGEGNLFWDPSDFLWKYKLDNLKPTKWDHDDDFFHIYVPFATVGEEHSLKVNFKSALYGNAILEYKFVVELY